MWPSNIELGLGPPHRIVHTAYTPARAELLGNAKGPPGNHNTTILKQISLSKMYTVCPKEDVTSNFVMRHTYINF